MTKRLRLLIICSAMMISCGVSKAISPMADMSDSKADQPKTKVQSMSFILLGDLHYDKIENHDMDWLSAKPGDLKQVTDGYVPNTKLNWDDFMGVISAKIRETKPAVKGIVQLGDVSEGLAGTTEKAMQMAGSVISALRDSKQSVPWILTKGNHDITGPGAKEAFVNVYTPFIREQISNQAVDNGSYTYQVGNTLFVVLDLWDSSTDPIAFVTKSLNSSSAKYKFVTMHEPAIPVSERCWHFMRNNESKRNEFLEVLAKNKAIVLTAHLHRYSVLKRETKFGPIIQIMTTSVIGKTRKAKPSYAFTTKDYGPSLVDWKPSYEPTTADARRKMLEQEARYVSYYKMCDLAGYGVLSIDDKRGEVLLQYYAAFASEPYDTINITELYNATK